MSCIVPCKAGSFGVLAGWSHTVALLNCIMAVRLLKEIKHLDLLSQHPVIEFFALHVLYVATHGAYRPAQSSKNIMAKKNDPHDQQQGC